MEESINLNILRNIVIIRVKMWMWRVREPSGGMVAWSGLALFVCVWVWRWWWWGCVCEGCLVKSQVVRLAPWERLGGCFQMGERGGG